MTAPTIAPAREAPLGRGGASTSILDRMNRSAVLKRALDVVGAAGGLLLLAPLLLIVAIAVRFMLGTPVLFRQPRAGLHQRPFTLVKFRTMRDLRDASGNLLPDGERLTRFGRFLRATSLDELPQLWNVLRGDMSLVGPRPLLLEYGPLYSPEQARRHEVRPGITGWAQVKGRNALSWPRKFELDVWYVDNRTMSLDLIILVTTLKLVIARAGIRHEGHDTAPPFRGNDV
ncbi:MAG TPA: sugar transferase [Longimicrobiales bacterium]|nr:sugar transferase [Longimicrobiales bacterium]